MARFKEMKFMNPRLRQDRTIKELDCSSSSLKLYNSSSTTDNSVRYDSKDDQLHSKQAPPISSTRKKNASNNKKTFAKP